MKVAAGILCWNLHDNRRVDLFDQTLESLRGQADFLLVADNGSTDDTATTVASTGVGVQFPRLTGFPHGNTCGYGMNKLARTLAQQTDGDVFILSNDDIVWQADAVDRLRRLYDVLSKNVAIVSGLVEPEFALPDREPWNQVLEVKTQAGEDVWYRKSAPGGAWTFRRRHLPLIFPVSTFPGIDDVPACDRLRENDFQVAAVDLAAHAGVGQSTWGNASHDRYMTTDLATLQAGWLT
jgi:hypothetical protein